MCDPWLNPNHYPSWNFSLHYVHLSILPSIHPSIHASIYSSVHPSVHASIHPSPKPTRGAPENILVRCLNNLRWVLSITRSWAPLQALLKTCILQHLTFSLRLKPSHPLEEPCYKQLISMSSSFQSNPKDHDHRWEQECRSVDKLRAFPLWVSSDAMPNYLSTSCFISSSPERNFNSFAWTELPLPLKNCSLFSGKYLQPLPLHILITYKHFEPLFLEAATSATQSVHCFQGANPFLNCFTLCCKPSQCML